ncbi:MAG: serine/threonine-protein kinase [Candidatus Hydrogenedentota bacterium]
METVFPKKADRPTIYHYKVDVILGQGGTGAVYRGLDPKTNEVVAIKMFRQNFFRNAMHQRDVAKTAKRWRKLSHPNVVRILDFLTGKEGDCLIIEYIDGPDLKRYLAQRAYNLQERLLIAAQICNGLQFIHESGFIHHDLKPANVLFTRKGQVKLTDFSLYGTGGLLGFLDRGYSDQITPMYVAPELIRKEKATKATDMYSLGVMFYLLFTGKHPFEMDNIQRLYLAHLHSAALHPTVINDIVPQSLGDIVMRLLAKDPERRWPDCDQLRIALATFGKSRI